MLKKVNKPGPSVLGKTMAPEKTPAHFEITSNELAKHFAASAGFPEYTHLIEDESDFSRPAAT
ncbi:hypothetical protein BGZ73_001676, partial [Actinomortierella ambigua]